MTVKYESLNFYIQTAKRAIGRWGHKSMLKSDDDISHVAYMIMRADQKFDGRGDLKGFRMSYARYGVLNLINKFKRSQRLPKPISLDASYSNEKTNHDFIEDGSKPIEDSIDEKNVEQLVMDFDFISDQEKVCIIRNKLNKETLEVIGNDLDLTKERIRQIVDSGMTKLSRYYQFK